ncbi:MAG TPA: hypothetical protein DDY98_03075, partial [Ruminococcaceae bacterium]|nr:hypothetical protein [Oscillospiraceae bacterium]
MSQWLIASDIDGTLNTKLRRLQPRNQYAIERFMRCGGHFILASGRPVASLERAYRRVHPNEPCVVLNGAGLYDFERREFIWKQTMEQPARAFVERMLSTYGNGLNGVEIGIFGAEQVYLVRAGVLSVGQMVGDKTAYAIKPIDEVPEDDWFKVVFWGAPNVLSKIKEEAKTEESGSFMATSPVSFEMLNAGVHKGVAVMKLAEQIGIEKKRVAAIGDYYNDWDMLKTVGLPACAGQAPQPIREICRYVACHCNNGCVADLINR